MVRKGVRKYLAKYISLRFAAILVNIIEKMTLIIGDAFNGSGTKELPLKNGHGGQPFRVPRKPLENILSTQVFLKAVSLLLSAPF